MDYIQQARVQYIDTFDHSKAQAVLDDLFDGNASMSEGFVENNILHRRPNKWTVLITKEGKKKYVYCGVKEALLPEIEEAYGHRCRFDKLGNFYLEITEEAEYQKLKTQKITKDLNKKINSESLKFITDHSMLRQKLCDAATDALRLKLLEWHGYDVASLELIDPDETPKNIMLRGVRKKNFDPCGDKAKRAYEEYVSAYEFLTGKKPEILEG